MRLPDGQERGAHVLQLGREDLHARLKLFVEGLVRESVHLQAPNQFVFVVDQGRQESALGFAQKHHARNDVFVLRLAEAGCVELVKRLGDVREVKGLS